MKPKHLAMLFMVITLLVPVGGPARSEETAHTAAAEVDAILKGMESRYNRPGFTADFTQESTLKAMELTDIATGSVTFGRPAMMRWEYERPEPQLIVTNGTDLWIYRPRENQVMVGSAPPFFSDGKGGSFLTDVRLIRRKFDVSLLEENNPDFFTLKLVPQEKGLDVSHIELWVSRHTFDVMQLTTYNPYEDTTRIVFNDIRFLDEVDPARFRFDIPAGADVLQMDE